LLEAGTAPQLSAAHALAGKEYADLLGDVLA
jgi:hypothetical protein